MKNNKIYENYKKQADFLLDFQMCRAYLNENCGVARIVEIILLKKFGNPLSERGIINIARATEGKRDAVVNLSREGFKASVSEILSKYVEERFDKMVSEIKVRLGNYPLKFRDIVERYG